MKEVTKKGGGIMGLWHWILGRKCLFCGATIDPRTSDICDACAASIQAENLEITLEESGTPVSLYRYAGPVREGLHRFKYNGISDLGRFCGKALAERYRALGDRAQAVTCVPRAKDGLPRMYNQSEVIAKAFAKEARLPLDSRLLRKRNGAKTQPECVDRHARRRNAEYAYRKGPSKRDITGLTVVLIDDLYTSGATAQVCAEILKKRGAAKVLIYTAMQTYRMPRRLVRSDASRHVHASLADEALWRTKIYRLRKGKEQKK